MVLEVNEKLQPKRDWVIMSYSSITMFLRKLIEIITSTGASYNILAIYLIKFND
jgi:hypothetical protein